MKNYLANILTALAVVLVLAVASSAQTVPVTADGESDTLRFYVGYSNLNVANQNLPGGNAGVDFRVGGYGKWRLGAVADGSYFYDTGLNGGPSSLDRYQLVVGPQLSYRFNKISVGGGGLFGATVFNSKQNGLRDFTRGTVGARVFVDYSFGKFFVTPIDFKRFYFDERTAPYTVLGARVGINVR